MPRRSSIVAVLFFAPALAIAACSSGAPSGSEVVAQNAPNSGGLNTIPRQWTKANCPITARVGVAACFSHTVTDQNGKILAAATPQGFGPPDLRAAYGLPATGGTGTIAIVDAQDDPTAEADLGTYRSQYGLPACTTANGCFKKVNQSGVQGSYPSADSGWATEISLDLDMASAACPSCKIILVEVNSSDMSDLGAGVNEAAALGANVISNSYGGAEDSTTVQESSEYFNHPGVLITASAGDDGYGASFPATSQYVLAVGGTSLSKSTGSTRGWTETACVERRQRLQRLRREALVPDGHRLQVPRRSRRLGRRRPEHRRRGLRLVRRHRRLDRRRRHERQLAARRLDLRPHRQGHRRDAAVPVLEPLALLRRDERLERQLQLDGEVPLHGGRRLRRPHRLGLAERRGLGNGEREQLGELVRQQLGQQ